MILTVSQIASIQHIGINFYQVKCAHLGHLKYTFYTSKDQDQLAVRSVAKARYYTLPHKHVPRKQSCSMA